MDMKQHDLNGCEQYGECGAVHSRGTRAVHQAGIYLSSSGANSFGLIPSSLQLILDAFEEVDCDSVKAKKTSSVPRSPLSFNVESMLPAIVDVIAKYGMPYRAFILQQCSYKKKHSLALNCF